MPAQGQDDMQASIFLAKLLGPVLVLVGVGALLNRRSMPELVQEFLVRPGLFFLTGIIDVSVGLAIVLTHNVWAADWRVLITIIGWMMVIRGAVRLLIPEQ